MIMKVGEFNFVIELVGMEKGRIKCVGLVGGYDDFDVGCLVEIIYLVEEFE